MADAPVWPAHKWPYPTPGQGPLPNKDLPPMKLAKKKKHQNRPKSHNQEVNA